MKGFQRKEISEKEKKQDFVQTNPRMAQALIEWFEDRGISEHLSVCDPCSGKNVISDALKKHFYNVTFFDLFFGRKKRNFLLHNGNYDILVMNCPYSDKYNFIKKAWERATTVIALFPLHISSYNDFIENYQDIPEYVGIVKMTPKLKLHEGTKDIRSGTATYAWYIWDKRNNTDFSKTWIKNLFKLRDYKEKI